MQNTCTHPKTYILHATTYTQAFTLSVLLVHSVVAATVCSPVSWDVVGTSLLLAYVSIGALVQPTDNFESESAQNIVDLNTSVGSIMSSAASQTTLARGGLCMLAVMHILLHIPADQQLYKSQFVLILGCLDAFMLFGHLWDRVLSLQVVLNCRLLYICLMALYNAALFITWKWYVAAPFVLRTAGAEGGKV